ncbi:uncharacterized protein LOC110445419, partial [Mizuhopecten yessoensis]|uniref:uncharacterized protein LOC110445419 n=1 Tax=Mizuhopecten yessoensis TaxID=6573 RepID=UPI000B45EF51
MDTQLLTRLAWCVLGCVFLSSVYAADTVTKDSEDNRTVDDVIDLDDSSITGNESLLEAADGKIIFETYPTKLVESSHDIISDDVDGFIGSGSGLEEEPRNVTELEPFTSLKTSGPIDTTPYATSSHVTDEHDDDDVEASANIEIVTAKSDESVTEEPSEDVFDDADKIPSFLKLCEKKNCKYGGVCVRTGDENVDCACPVQCGNEFGNQLCGSDGSLYPSPCHMEQQACEQQQNITRADYRACSPYETFCEENTAPSWSSWSIWLQSGSTDFRVRYCKIGGSVAETQANCGNDRIEVRPCKKRDVMPCSSEFGEESQQYEYECAGTDMQDVQAIGSPYETFCEENTAPSWSSWSIWLQSGSTDFRVRYCKIGGSVAETQANCGNDRIEVRPCKKRDVMPCSSEFGEESQQYEYECAGTDMQDVQAI